MNLQPETGWDINSGKTVLVFDVVLVVVVACAVVDAVVVDAVVADSVAVDAVAVDAVVVDAVLVDAVAVDAVAVDAVAVDAVVVDAVAVDASYIKIIMAELRRGRCLDATTPCRVHTVKGQRLAFHVSLSTDRPHPKLCFLRRIMYSSQVFLNV